MANEGRVTVSMSATGGVSTGELTKTFDWGVSQGDAKLLPSIGTTEETVTFTDIGTNGQIVLQNKDATNYVQVGFSTGVYGIRLKPGTGGGIPVAFTLEPGATLYMKANTAACRVSVWHLGGV
jgi:hypothetical protein